MNTPGPRPLPSRIIRRVLRAPVVLLVWLWFLIDETLIAAFRPLVRWLLSFATVHRLENWIGRQTRWVSLAILAVPLILIEPPKIIAVLLIAEGKVRIGTIMLVASYLIGLVAVERVFHITKPKLMTIPAFAWSYGHFERLRDWATRIVTQSPAWRAISAWLKRARLRAHRPLAAARRAGLRTVASLRRLVRD